MDARYIVLLCQILLAYGSTLKRHSDQNNIISKTKVELTPLFVSGHLNDLVILSAPIVNAKDVHHYITRPNGETLKLYIKRQTKNRKGKFKYLGNDIAVKRIRDGANALIKHLDDLQMFNVKYDNVTNREDGMGVNEFALGPLSEEDHGNWVFSAYYEDLQGDWMELFQVITIEIIEIIAPESRIIVVEEGGIFEPSFPYPLKGLESCELIAPSSTYDRFYDRSQKDFNKCGYIVENMEKCDEGTWTIIGVGKIVYEIKFLLTVSNRELPNNSDVDGYMDFNSLKEINTLF